MTESNHELTTVTESNHELTRRDAIAALAATGVAATRVGPLAWDAIDRDEGFTDHERATVEAVARTVYPGVVSGVTDFVETYVVGRVRDRPSYVDGMADAIAELDEYSRHFEEAAFRDLSGPTRDDILRGMGVAMADPVPDGEPRERVRFYLVDDLLFALYTSPTGGELVGLENPPGHPGGIESYQRGSPEPVDGVDVESMDGIDVESVDGGDVGD